MYVDRKVEEIHGMLEDGLSVLRASQPVAANSEVTGSATKELNAELQQIGFKLVVVPT